MAKRVLYYGFCSLNGVEIGRSETIPYSEIMKESMELELDKLITGTKLTFHFNQRENDASNSIATKIISTEVAKMIICKVVCRDE